jgi:hypothetical protein
VAHPRTVGPVEVRRDCRHYSTRSESPDHVVQRCRMRANQEIPFACPEGCLFFEPRPIADAGWLRFDA